MFASGNEQAGLRMQFEAVKIAWRVTVEKHGPILASAALRNNFHQGVFRAGGLTIGCVLPKNLNNTFYTFFSVKRGVYCGKNFF